MLSFKTLSAAALLLAASVSAAPYCSDDAPTVPEPAVSETPSKTESEPRVTHSIVAGRGGLLFDPENVVAEIGDVIEWHFTPKNHSIAQSSFDKPCQELEDGTSFFAGFNFAVEEGQSENVFQLVVETTDPIWYYCPQTNGEHCKNGMTGVINQNFDNQDVSLRAHKELAKNVDGAQVPAVEQGGEVIPNPNPDAGF